MAIRTSLFTKVMRDRSLEEACELIAEAGYDGVEPMGRDPHLGPDTDEERVEELAAVVDELGLGIPCLASYTGGYVGRSDEEREAELDDLESFLRFTDVLDCDLVRHSPGGGPVREATEADFEEAAEWMRRAADLAADYDARLGIEIHAHKLSETVDSTRKILELIDRDNVGAIHDAGNMYIVDTYFGRQSVEELGDDLFHVHVKDELRVDDESLPNAFSMETDNGMEVFQHNRLGEGAVDHLPLFEALVEHGYDGYVTDECHIDYDEPDDDVRLAESELAELERLIGQAES